jgi:hypothetical protein
VRFVASNETQATLWSDYIKYFQEKNRAAVVALKKHILYLLPPCHDSLKFKKFGEKEMLGLFVDMAEAEGKRFWTILIS